MFVGFARAGTVGFAGLCARSGVPRSCGYKWLGRFAQEGEAGLIDRSRRPLTSPGRSSATVAAAAVAVAVAVAFRRAHPVWGGRKIAPCLARDAGLQVVPPTVTGIFRGAGRGLGG